MVTESKKLTGTDGGHGNDYTLVGGHTIEKVENHCSTIKTFFAIKIRKNFFFRPKTAR